MAYISKEQQEFINQLEKSVCVELATIALEYFKSGYTIAEFADRVKRAMAYVGRS